MMTTDSGKRHVLEHARSELASFGWRMKLEETEHVFMLHLEHDLTSPHNIVFDNAGSGHERRLKDTLDHREFAAIRDAPLETPNARLIRALRLSAAAKDWPQYVLQDIATILRSQQLLTDEEAAWLRVAGPAWATQ